MIVSLFSQYSSNPFTYEEVEIHYEDDQKIEKTPSSQPHIIHTNLNYLNTICGINIQIPKAIELLNRMGLRAQKTSEETLQVFQLFFLKKIFIWGGRDAIEKKIQTSSYFLFSKILSFN